MKIDGLRRQLKRLAHAAYLRGRFLWLCCRGWPCVAVGFVLVLSLPSVLAFASVWALARFVRIGLLNFVDHMSHHPLLSLLSASFSVFVIAMLLRLTGDLLRARQLNAGYMRRKRKGTPLNAVSQDLLARDAAVTSVLKKLRNPAGARTEYIGLFGRWGEGKTFVLNQVKERIVKEKDLSLELVDFNPWQFADKKMMPMVLFEEIGKALERRGRNGERCAFRRFGVSVAGFRYRALASAIPTIGSLICAIWEFFEPLDGIKSRLNVIAESGQQSARAVYEVAWGALRRFVEDGLNHPRRIHSEDIAAALKAEDAVNLLARVLEYDEEEHAGSGRGSLLSWLTDADYDCLSSLYFDRIFALQTNGRLLNRPLNQSLWKMWIRGAERLGPEGVEKVKTQLAKDATAYPAAIGIPRMFPADFVEYPYVSFHGVDYARLCRYVDVERLVCTLAGKEPELGPADYIYLKMLQYANVEAKAGKAVSANSLIDFYEKDRSLQNEVKARCRIGVTNEEGGKHEAAVF